MSLLRDDEQGNRLFPKTGFAAELVERRLEELRAMLTPDTLGSFSMHALADSEHYMPDFRVVGDHAYAVFRRFNAVFSGLESVAGAIEDDLLEMCVEIFNGGEEGRCNITGGGTESIYCAMVAMREWAREHKPDITDPELLAPYTAHAAFSRAAHYFDLRITRVPVGDDWRIDPRDVEAHITDSTIGMVGSAPNWPYGMFDPIEELAAIASDHDLWFHTDACVGGYLAPFAKKAGFPIPDFDLSVPGVRSLSADLHKYGYVPKPCSTVLWRSEEEQKYHYFLASDWPDGPYLTQGMLGSRPFAPTAAAWAILNVLGEDGFTDVARQIMTSKERLVEGIAEIEGLRPWNNDLSLVVVTADGLEIERVVGGMQARGWVLLGNQQPPSIHLTVDPIDDHRIGRFLHDLSEVTTAVRSGEDVARGNLDYGMATDPGAARWITDAARLTSQPDSAGR